MAASSATVRISKTDAPSPRDSGVRPDGFPRRRSSSIANWRRFALEGGIVQRVQRDPSQSFELGQSRMTRRRLGPVGFEKPDAVGVLRHPFGFGAETLADKQPLEHVVTLLPLADGRDRGAGSIQRAIIDLSHWNSAVTLFARQVGDSATSRRRQQDNFRWRGRRQVLGSKVCSLHVSEPYSKIGVGDPESPINPFGAMLVQ
jgi:hypothetical protein